MGDVTSQRPTEFYQLFLIKDGWGIRVRREHLALIEDCLRNASVRSAPVLQKDFSVAPFTGPPASGWGFGPVFSEAPCAFEEYIEWHCAAPRIIRNGQDADWTALYAAALSWQILFQTLEFILYEEKLKDVSPVFRIELFLTRSRPMHSAPMCAYGAPRIWEWIERTGHSQLEDIESVMWESFRTMSSSPGRTWRFAKREFHASSIPPGRIHFDVPGSCSCLDCGGNGAQAGDILEFHSHNVDTVLQQLALFTGAVALGERIKREIF